MAQQDLPEQRRREVPPQFLVKGHRSAWTTLTLRLNQSTEMAAGGAFRVIVQKSRSCLGQEWIHRKVQCYAFQMNVASCHVLAVT